MNKHIAPALRIGNLILEFVQEKLSLVFKPSFNPMYYLGALGYFFFWITLATGFYVFLFYNMSLTGSWESMQRLMVEQRHFGGIIRSVHRYASDGLILVIALHVLQHIFSDRFRQYRWVAWMTGMVLLPLLWVDGISGYALVFDDKGLMASTQLAGYIDAFPLMIEPFSRNFIPGGSISSLYFFVITYLHVSIPIGMLLILWVHSVRLSRPVINPPLQVAIALGVILVVVSILKPAVLGPQADLSKLASSPDIDWFYMFPFPLTDMLSLQPKTVWFFGGGIFLFMASLPWVVRGGAVPVPARINLEDCTGCLLCPQACPFEAIAVKPRSDGSKYEFEVEIIPERCSSCGLCLPSCPFPAITVDKWSHEYFARQIKSLFPNGGKGKTMLFACERSILDPGIFKQVQNAELMLIPCMGILGERYIKTCLKHGVDGIIVVACVLENGHFRLHQRKLDVTSMETGGVKRLKVVSASRFDTKGTLERIRKAQTEFAGVK